MAAFVPGKLYRYKCHRATMHFVVSVNYLTSVGSSRGSGQYTILDGQGICRPTWYMLHSEWEEVES